MISSVDIFLIIGYFLIIAVVGYLSSRKESKEDFFIAGKNLGVFESICSLGSTKISAGIMFAFVAFIYLFGISALWMIFGVIIGYFLFLLFAIKIKKEGDLNQYYTMGDYFRHRYGLIVGKVVSIVVFVFIFLNFSIQLIAGSKMFESLTNTHFAIGVVLFSTIILFYLYLGGFKAVVKTDVVQFISMILFLFILGVFLFSNFEYIPSQWEIMNAGPMAIISLLLVGSILPFSSPDLWQRVFATKDVKTLKKSFIFTIMLFALVGILLSLVAIIIKIKLPGIDPEMALISGFQFLLPSGLLGIGLITLFAAIMSSADSLAFVSSEMLLYNVLEFKRTVGNLKIGIILILILGSFSAIFFRSLLDVVHLCLGLYAIISSVVLMTWFRKYISRIVIISGVLIGVLSILSTTLIMGIGKYLIIVGFLGGILGMIIGKCISLIVER